MGYDNFGLKIGVEGEREFKNSIREINSLFKILKSEMNLVTSAFKGNASSMESLKSKSSILKREIESQKEKITILKSALDNASKSFGESDKRTQAWVTKLNYAEAELNNMEHELKDVNSQLEKSKTPLDKLNAELSEQGTKLKELQTEYKNIVLSQGKNSSEAKSLASEIKSLNNDIRENKEKLNAAEKATSQLGDEMNDTKNQASKLSEGFTVMKGIIANLATDAIKRLGRDIVGAIKSVVSSGIEFESAFAGVRKTVNATD